MRPLVTFPDPEEAVILHLRSLGIADTVTVSFPMQALADTAKHIQVELEAGNTDDYPVTERAQVRVTCYVGGGRRGSVKALASLAQGHLYRFQSDAVAGTSPLTGRSDVITDPTTKNLMVWFTFRVNLKATQLAS